VKAVKICSSLGLRVTSICFFFSQASGFCSHLKKSFHCLDLGIVLQWNFSNIKPSYMKFPKRIYKRNQNEMLFCLIS